MKLGITSGVYLNRYGVAAGMEKMKEHGYDCLDLQWFVDTESDLFALPAMTWEKKLEEVRHIAAETGVEITQTHGPWRCPIHDETEEKRAERFEKMAKSLYGTAVVGAPWMAIHPIMPTGGVDKDPDLTRRVNPEFFSRLALEAGRAGAGIALENMPFRGQVYAKPADTAALIRQIGSPYLRGILDTGHAMIHSVPLDQAVRDFGDTLVCLHVHDNNGKNDLHEIPGNGIADWETFRKALRESGYTGSVSLEIHSFPADLSLEALESAERGLAEKMKALLC